MAVPEAELQPKGMATSKPDLYQQFFEQLSGTEESEAAFFTLLPQATAASQEALRAVAHATAGNQREAFKQQFQSICGPPPDLHGEWQAAATLDDVGSALDSCNIAVAQAVEQVDEHGMLLVPLGQEHSSCILDMTAQLHVQVDNLISVQAATDDGSSGTATHGLAPVATAYVPTAVQLATGGPLQGMQQHCSNCSGLIDADGSRQCTASRISQQLQQQADQWTQMSHAAQLPGTAFDQSASRVSQSHPDAVLPQAKGPQAQALSLSAQLVGVQSTGDDDIADASGQDTSSEQADQDSNDVQVFRLDPSFDYDNVKLTAKNFPPSWAS